MNNLINVPYDYNPLNPKDDSQFVFRWVALNCNSSPFPWIKDGWDYVSDSSGKSIYRLIKPQFIYPVPFQPNHSHHMVQFLSENKYKDTSDDDDLSSISENIIIDELQDNPLPSPLVFKNNSTRENQQPPIKLNNPTADTFYSAVHF